MEKKWGELSFRILAFLLTLLALIFLWESPYILALFVLVIFVATDRLWHKPNDYFIYAIGGILGTATEIVLISRGAWYYAKPTFFGVPVWLPFVWGFAILLVVKLSETVSGIRKG